MAETMINAHPLTAQHHIRYLLDRGKVNQASFWHKAAGALGRPEAPLSRIVEVAKEAIKGIFLSERAKAVMF
jgi:hypothetical protein